MRVCIYTDVHFSEYSSILRSVGDKYSTRLEGLIDSLSWAEKTAQLYKCDEIFCLGDFFDRPDLNSKELTALKEVNWAELPHTFLVGNHEASTKDLTYNSVMALKNYNFEVIAQPTIRHIENAEFLFLPYMLEDDRKPLENYWRDFNVTPQPGRKRIIFSHNDIKNIQYGQFESKIGFEIADIQKNCDLFLNGHLHNGTHFCTNGINLGNLTGQNFSEDAEKYFHNVFILDTSDYSIESIENPFAFNFYKLNCIDVNDINKIVNMKQNAIVSISCPEKYKQQLQNLLSKNTSKILASRILYTQEKSQKKDSLQLDLSMDHLAKFAEFCKEKIENSSVLEIELSEVCK